MRTSPHWQSLASFGAAILPPRLCIVGLDSVQIVGPAAWASASAAAQRRNGIQRRRQHRAVMAVAPVRTRPSGVPQASVTRWRLVAALPRSVGFGPVAEPRPPAAPRCRGWPGSSGSRPPRAVAPAAPDAGAPIRQPPVSRAAAASTSPAAAVHLGCQQLPGDVPAQNEQNSPQGGPVLDRRPAAAPPVPHRVRTFKRSNDPTFPRRATTSSACTWIRLTMPWCCPWTIF